MKLEFRRWLYAAIVVAGSCVVCSCGHYPAPIRSVINIILTKTTETMIVIDGLPLKDWSKLQKFTALEHLFIAEDMASQITDKHLDVLSTLCMPRLRDISFAYCSQVTDNGVQALTNLPSTTSLQLIGVGITDEGLKTLAEGMPHLEGINVCQCRYLTFAGFMNLANSHSIKSVTLSIENLSQEQLKWLILKVTNVTWWTIQDLKGDLDLEPFRVLKKQMNITIQIEDADKCVRGI